MKINPQNVSPEKIAPCESSPRWENFPQWNPSPLINYTSERKNKITKFFALKKAVQYNIFIKITKILFDTQMISQKILGLDIFFTEWKKIQKSNESASHQVAFTCQVKENWN